MPYLRMLFCNPASKGIALRKQSGGLSSLIGEKISRKSNHFSLCQQGLRKNAGLRRKPGTCAAGAGETPVPQGGVLRGARRFASCLERACARWVAETFERILTDFVREGRSFADAKRGRQEKRLKISQKAAHICLCRHPLVYEKRGANHT
jgi:hypothetical protein